MSNNQIEFGLTLANRGLLFGLTSVQEIFEMAKIAEDSGAFNWL